MTDIMLKYRQANNANPYYNKIVLYMPNCELDAYIEEHGLEKPKFTGCNRLSHKCYIVATHMREVARAEGNEMEDV